jgi:uncharacterized protein (DUF1330 family)
MPAYWIARAKVNDADAYKRYTDVAGDVVGQYGGRFLARGGPFQIVEGPSHFTRFVVAEFPTMQAAVACHSSDAYQGAASNRRGGGGDVEIVIVEGV